MREPFSFGTPERRRFAMQFGYDMRPSFWQEVRSNSHLVIAAIGTAALLGVAAVALWLALPASDRQAAASPEQTIPTVPVKTTKITPVGAAVAAAAVPQARKSDAIPTTVAAAQDNIPALAANDPRWTGSQLKAASASDSTAPSQVADKAPDKQTAAFAQPAADTNAATELAKVAAPGATAGNHPDGAQTAAIPEVQPQVPAQEPAAEGDDSQAKAKPRKAAAAGTGRILRAVTMRSGPKKNAAAIGTVPAKTSVQVMSCKKWCQITYNGKTGWIYKSYIKTGA
ncbi:SH3 domain-containing protein [Mesorhizobium ciceri]|uniref:SH3 domain-containing protein n=1 Tax=Mesorhizobium ciceri TaxID=39645 RepID=UPI0007A938EE|nr:SH3 domain-containing protein [Mesorhizobium ciceri]AMY03757.1 peptide-binding protein [Mesorhizobium ciceri biovar biserrulae]